MMEKLFETTTGVHSEATQRLEREKSRVQEGGGMLAVCMGAQLLSLCALHYAATAANAGWWGALALLLPTGGLYLAGWLCSRKLAPNAAEKPLFRAIMGGFAVLFWSDMAIDLLSMIELTQAFVLTKGPRLSLSLSAALALSLAAPASRPAASARTAHVLRWFFLFSFVFAAATVLPQGKAGFLFPMAGYGVGHTLRLTGFLCGGAWHAAVLPLLARGASEQARRAGRVYIHTLVTIVCIAALLLCCAYVLPATALSGQWGYAMRLQILMKISPSTLSWSLMLLSELLLFAAAFAAAGTFACSCLQKAFKRPARMLPLALLCVPLAVSGVDSNAQALIRLLPWRYALSLCLSIAALGVRK